MTELNIHTLPPCVVRRVPHRDRVQGARAPPPRSAHGRPLRCGWRCGPPSSGSSARRPSDPIDRFKVDFGKDHRCGWGAFRDMKTNTCGCALQKPSCQPGFFWTVSYEVFANTKDFDGVRYSSCIFQPSRVLHGPHEHGRGHRPGRFGNLEHHSHSRSRLKEDVPPSGVAQTTPPITCFPHMGFFGLRGCGLYGLLRILCGMFAPIYDPGGGVRDPEKGPMAVMKRQVHPRRSCTVWHTWFCDHVSSADVACSGGGAIHKHGTPPPHSNAPTKLTIWKHLCSRFPLVEPRITNSARSSSVDSPKENLQKVMQASENNRIIPVYTMPSKLTCLKREILQHP